MSIRLPIPLLVAVGGPALLSACTADTTPAWAADRFALEPAEAGEVVPAAFQIWQVYGPDWADRPRPRYYRCAVVVELELASCEFPGCTPCADCEISWTVQGSAVTDSDCDEVPDLPALTALGIGTIAPSLRDEPETADATAGSWARYDGAEWVAHGWTDGEPASPTAPPLSAWPVFAWPL